MDQILLSLSPESFDIAMTHQAYHILKQIATIVSIFMAEVKRVTKRDEEKGNDNNKWNEGRKNCLDDFHMEQKSSS